MQKFILVLFLTCFCACQNQSPQQQKINLTTSIQHSKDTLEVAELDSVLYLILTKNKLKVSKKQDYCGGDCSGKIEEFTYSSHQRLVIQQESCGEYSYETTYFYFQDNQLFYQRKVSYTNHLKVSPDSTMEQRYYFAKQQVRVLERKDIAAYWRDTVTHLPFTEKILPLQSTLHECLKEEKELWLLKDECGE